MFSLAADTPHGLPLITTLAMGFTCAWILGLLTQWLRLSPIVGYLLAGVLIGPHTPGFVGDIGIAQQLAEVGVILLMFGVGLHFQIKDLAAVRNIAIPGAVGQSLVAMLLGLGAFAAFGWEMKPSLVMGMAMAVASTVVLIRVLTDNNALGTPAGHAAVGWLIVEDIFTVIFLVLLPIMGQSGGSGAAAGQGGGTNIWLALGVAFLKLGALVAVVLIAGSKVLPFVLVRVARLRSRELFTLTILVLSISVAAGAYQFFGASMALGAFLAGMVVAQSPVSQQAASDALPLRDAFAVLFFVSVGMLFNPMILVEHPGLVLAALGIVLIAKPLAALVIVAALGHSARTGLTVAIGLAQIGEFSFILSEVGRANGLLPESGHSVLVAAAILSITANPLLFRLVGPAEAALKRSPLLWKLLQGRAEQRTRAENAEAIAALKNEQRVNDRTAVVVGYGLVGCAVERLLRHAGMRTVVIDLNMDTVNAINRARGGGDHTGAIGIFGDAASHAVLEQAGVADAGYLVVTMAAQANPTPVVVQARELNPDMHIFVRAGYLRDRRALEIAGVTEAVFEEAETAIGLVRAVMSDLGEGAAAIEREIALIRRASEHEASFPTPAAERGPNHTPARQS